METWVARGVFCAVVLFLHGCSHRVPLTYTLMREQGLGEAELKRLQFYVSHDLVLRREVRTDRAREVTGEARLLVIDGRQIEVVRLRAGTPGVATAVGPDWIALRFEQGAAVLRFRALSRPLEKDPKRVASTVFSQEGEEIIVESPRDIWEDSYKLAAVGWTFREDQGFQGRVLYGGREFSTGDSGARAYLLIDQDALTRVAAEGRVLPGVLLPGAGMEVQR